MGFSLQWLPLLQSTGSRHTGFSSCGSLAPECGLTHSELWVTTVLSLSALQHVEPSQKRDSTCVFCFDRKILTPCATREVLLKKNIRVVTNNCIERVHRYRKIRKCFTLTWCWDIIPESMKRKLQEITGKRDNREKMTRQNNYLYVFYTNFICQPKILEILPRDLLIKCKKVSRVRWTRYFKVTT